MLFIFGWYFSSFLSGSPWKSPSAMIPRRRIRKDPSAVNKPLSLDWIVLRGIEKIILIWIQITMTSRILEQVATTTWAEPANRSPVRDYKSWILTDCQYVQMCVLWKTLWKKDTVPTENETILILATGMATLLEYCRVFESFGWGETKIQH